jgi:hypothetical protein
MGQQVAGLERTWAELAAQARVWLAQFADQGAALQGPARSFGAAIPTAEPLNTAVPAPDPPQRFTVIGADGAHIPPDRHSVALYYLINVGSLVYRHGSGQAPEARSLPRLTYQQDDLYEGGSLISARLLAMRRDQAEVEQLAQLVEAEPPGPTLALVDGTLILWGAEALPAGDQKAEVDRYLAQFDRIRQQGAALAAFTSRPRATEVVRLLHLASSGGDVDQASQQPNPLARLPDEDVFSFLSPGARSALFVSSRDVNRTLYATAGHEVLFFYVNVASEGDPPIVARIEIPAWVAADPRLLALVHAGVMAQSRVLGGFPYVLARADELAYISGPERQRLEEMIGTALLAAGLPSELSYKALYKSMTRRGGR